MKEGIFKSILTSAICMLMLILIFSSIYTHIFTDDILHTINANIKLLKALVLVVILKIMFYSD